MKLFSYKRIIAYLFDIIIVTIMATFLTCFLPENKEYEKSVQEYAEVLNEATQDSISQKDFVNKTNDIIYKMNQNSVTITIVTTVLTIFYFVVFAYFMNGQTFGKKLMNLKIISVNKKKLTMNNYLIRGLFVNSILMNVFGILFLLTLNKNVYIKANDIITYIFGIIYIVTFSMILFRDDKRGLHDYLAGTKVISLKNYVEDDAQEIKKILNKDSKIKDVDIIGDKNIKI